MIMLFLNWYDNLLDMLEVYLNLTQKSNKIDNAPKPPSSLINLGI